MFEAFDAALRVFFPGTAPAFGTRRVTLD